MMSITFPPNSIFFLDFDDTLIEPQPDPTCFDIPEDLRTTIRELSQNTKIHFALVTGRSVDQIDRFFSPFLCPIIGCHGCEERLNPKDIPIAAHNEIPEGLHSEIEKIVQRYPNCLIEDKYFTFAVHLPDPGLTLLKKDINDLLKNQASNYYLAHYGTCLEVRPNDITKGDILARLISRGGKFYGLKPVYIGNDAESDLSLKIILQFDGTLIPVGPAYANRKIGFSSPAEARLFLRTIAQR
ncbi:MAG: trehalose-phosphatase [Alphaproteobacteria bacterium]|nr:trehalose-phosphatase [Alphaproteobacteria bacterium]